MLGWAIAFFVAAVLVALLALGGAVSTFSVLAKVLFWVFLIGFVFSLVMHYSRSRT